MKKTWRNVWLVTTVLVLVLEFWAVIRKTIGDTLSEQVIPFVLHNEARRLVTLGLWLTFATWLTWHWWFQYWINGQYFPKR